LIKPILIAQLSQKGYRFTRGVLTLVDCINIFYFAE